MSMITPSKIGTKIRCIITCCVRGNVEENVDEEKTKARRLSGISRSMCVKSTTFWCTLAQISQETFTFTIGEGQNFVKRSYFRDFWKKKRIWELFLFLYLRVEPKVTFVD